MMEWQPIETAPRSEVDVLLYFEDSQPIQVGGYFRGEWLSALHGSEFRSDPVAWMPLPKPPAM